MTVKYSRPACTLGYSLANQERILREQAEGLARHLGGSPVESCNALTELGDLIIYSPQRDAVCAASHLRLHLLLQLAISSAAPQALELERYAALDMLPQRLRDAYLCGAEDRRDALLAAGAITAEQAADIQFPTAYGREHNGKQMFG